MPRPLRITSGLFFFPRGGSSHLARSLCRSLAALGDRVTLAAGSLGDPGGRSHARTFFAGIDVEPVDYGPGSGIPFQPSYEERPDAPDPVFASVPDEPYERLVGAWAEALARAGAAEADVLHLHHLTPIHEAAARRFDDRPVVAELHGTELGMLREIEGGAPWAHAAAWAERMRRWASASRSLLVAPGIAGEAASRLGLPGDRFVELPGGVDLDLFDRRPVRGDQRLAFWRRWLVEEPQGWDESGVPGSIRYDDRDLEPIARGLPVVLFVGRYTEVKRIPLLLRAHARAQAAAGTPVPLVLVGGHPGEWEGEHPARVAGPGVLLAGWHAHDALADAINAADLVVLPSRSEAFGLVLAEAMACGVPVVATAAQGPSRIVDDGETGWLVAVDDEGALAVALAEAVADEQERERRGRLAYERARARYGEAAVAARVHETLAQATT
ncbi:MAG TPA: glycosyltransferase family 4 protein [Gaiellaceae bacterium]|nr:glycosyltransferase family 4 protein [Gaiellaceae bacterium]